MLNIVCAQLGDMDKTIFVDTDIHKGSEIDDIPDDPFQLLTDAQSFLVYECLSCGALIRRRRRVNLQKYRCGRCMGKLRLSEKA